MRRPRGADRIGEEFRSEPFQFLRSMMYTSKKANELKLGNHADRQTDP